MKHTRFRKTLIAKSISVLLAASVVTPAFAEQSEEVEKDENGNRIEVVEVKGIRGSVARAMDMKREAIGVVDAISAEDIGKFPDTNLAESLQRISGVSIDRSNGEGSKVTVRGFGPDFNLVTLNGRQMPTAATSGGTAPSTRSFDFANLASESVSAVEIYKTGRADMPSGGIGSSININTARPLDNDGMKATIGLKGVMDTSVVKGDEITPEISGLFSNTFNDGKFGILFSASVQERSNREQVAQIDGWRDNVTLPADTIMSDNNQNPDGNTWYPRNYKFDVGDTDRKRVNGQLVLQFAPTEDFKATVDYTMSQLDVDAYRDEFGVWFEGGGNLLDDSVVINENGTVTNLAEAQGGIDYFSYFNSSTNENDSIGINIEWHPTESLKLTFDAHDSSAKAGGNGQGNDNLIIMSHPVDAKAFDIMPGHDMPTLSLDYFRDTTDTYASGIDSILMIANKSYMQTDIKQYQVDGQWTNLRDGDLVSIDFGMGTNEVFSMSTFAGTQYNLGFLGGNQALFSDDLFVQVSTENMLQDFSGSEGLLPYYFRYNPADAMAQAEAGFGLPNVPGPIDADHRITEETVHAYAQFNLNGDFNDMPYHIKAGLRYEKTDVTSNSLDEEPLYIAWQSSSEFRTIFTQDGTNYTNVVGQYDAYLPSVDFDIEPIDDVIFRASFSRTLTRNNMGSMRGVTTVSPNPKVGARTASSGNPDLLPYLSNNIDLSLEYYYGEGSYISAGYFSKVVDNFTVSTIVEEEIWGLRDPFEGQRANDVRAQLQAEGVETTAGNIFDRMLELYGVQNDAGDMEIRQSETDPLIQWQVTKDINGETVEIDGWEFAAQHIFGESGFGAMANFTLVDGDVGYDNEKIGNQFTLPGMSDSYNLIAFYDKDGIQARITYNWRDSFLNATGQPIGGNAPQHTEAYGQWDISLGYNITEQWSVTFEGLNITEETQRVYGRYEEQMLFSRQYGARYNIATRYNF